MKTFIPLLTVLLFGFGVAIPLAAQENEPTPEAQETGVESQTTADARYLRLRGGGEVVGSIVKETPDEMFLDIGPRIISVPVASILENLPLAQAAGKSSAGQMGVGTGTFDPETGSVIFEAREETGGMLSRQEVVDRAKQSVVLISNPRGGGSGFVLDREGRLVTNHHVIRNEKYHTVNIFRPRDGQWERVKFENVPVEAFSDLYDIAILKLDMDEVEEEGISLKPLPVAEPGSLSVGDNVYAIGNPGIGGRFLEHTVSEGIVSSLARNINDVLYIQTTAAVNPGNSGGPLINSEGEVAGLVTLKAFFQEGIAFALPSDLIRHFLRHSESYAFSEMAENEGYRYLPPE